MVNQVFFIQMNENFFYCIGQVFVYGEVFMFLVDGVVEMVYLMGNGVVRFCFLFLDFVDESFVVVVVMGFIFFCGNFVFNDYLGSDFGVVSIDLLQGVFVLYVLIVDYGIYDGLLEGVIYM